MKNGFGRRFKRQTLTIGLSAAVIAAVILLNVLVTALCSDNRWFIDMTSGRFRDKDVPTYGGLYTLSDGAEHMLGLTFDSVNENRSEDDSVKVDIIFCADPDLLCANDNMRLVYHTAKAMEKAYPDQISVSTRDVWSNPSSVDAYRTNAYSSIYQTNVILASGSEFRVYNQKSFFTYSEDTDSEPWAYSGEKTFIKGIIAVTKADAPIACLTTNHGEPFATEEGRAEYSLFMSVLESAGYEVRFLDLSQEEIPENCRLIVTLDPVTDFQSNFLDPTAVSEVDKLDKFLANAYSFMVLADADTPSLPNLEEYLEEWGIAFQRGQNLSGSVVFDKDQALDGSGNTFVGTYENEALGGSVTEDMRKYGGSPKVVFSNTIGISLSDTYEFASSIADEEAGTGAFHYGYYSSNQIQRDIYDVFRASKTAVTYEKKDGQITNQIVDTANELNLFKLMTLSRENRYIGEGQGYTNINDVSYVCAVGSTYFASNEVLGTNTYGNTDLLLSVLRVIGREIEPVGIKFKPFYSPEVNATSLANSNPTGTTVFLVLLPLVSFGAAGAIILLRRRFRT